MKPGFLKKVAKKFGTPVYAYDEELIRKNYRTFHSAFKTRYKKVKVMYAMKANSNLAIANILRQEGCGVDVISQGEIVAAKKAGIKSSDIMLTNNSKTDEEIDYAIEEGIVLNLDSMNELYRLGKIAKKKRKTAKISFRVNPDVNPGTHPKISTGLKGSKFGLHFEEDIAYNAYKTARDMDYVEVAGVQTHIGSQITDLTAFHDACTKIMEFACRLKEELELELKFIDMGGGLGISYTGEKIPTADDFAETIVPIVKEYNKKMGYTPELWLEPGRYIVGDAGVLLCEVTGVKETPYKKFVNLDCGFNVLIRPAMYDAYHRVEVITKDGAEATETYDIAGNVCESGDLLAKDRKLPPVESGDIIAIYDAGAYGYSMASQYNSRPRPAEILVWGETVEVIRERETLDDIFKGQRVPKDLLK